MKTIIILGDGMADEPIEALGNRTPLQAAHKPYIDLLASKGKSGLLDTIPAGFKPGSEIANLSVMGYNVPEVFEGRGSLEAASMDIEIEADEMAMRCNLITIEDGKIKNHSAGHISSEEAAELIRFLDKELNDGIVSLYPGVSYRHLLKMKDGDKNLDCTAPHDVLGTSFDEVLIKAETPDAEKTAEYLNSLIYKSQELLKDHPVNKKRVSEGKDPANSIWPWSPGYRPKMKTLQELYGIKNGSVISAVDLIMGIGKYAGLKLIHVEGATGLYDTNYEGKAEAAIKALENDDFVYLHVEASDEAGHEGDYELKTKTIEYLDSRIVKPIVEATKNWQEPVTIAILPDHPTPCHLRTHTNKPVPFLIYRSNGKADSVRVYDEFESGKGAYGTLVGQEFMDTLFSPEE